MLINAHFSVNPPRPLMPGQINVAGAHIQEPKPLPKDIKSFLDGAKYGVILFSLGSIIQSKDMPIGKMRIFANVFKTLKQRVIMKYEDHMLPSVSSNVMTVQWLPQAGLNKYRNIFSKYFRINRFRHSRTSKCHTFHHSRRYLWITRGSLSWCANAFYSILRRPIQKCIKGGTR